MEYVWFDTAVVTTFYEYIKSVTGTTVNIVIPIFGFLVGLGLIIRVVKMFVK